MSNPCRTPKRDRNAFFLPLIFLFFGAIPLLFGQSEAAIFPEKPSEAIYVHDYAGWLSAAEVQFLQQKLARYSDSTSTQIVVMIRPDIGGYDKASYATELFNRWGIGRQGKNNGVLVLVKSAPPERGVFINTGYGAEAALPDILCARIARNVIIPQFQQGNYFKGLDDGTTVIIEALSGEFTNDGSHASNQGLPLWVVLAFMLIFVIIILILILVQKHKGIVYTDKGTFESMPRRRNRNNDWGGGGGWIIGGGGNWGNSGGSGWGGGDIFGGGLSGGGGAGGDW